MKLSDFEKLFEEDQTEKGTDDHKEFCASLIEMAQELLVSESFPNGMKINPRSGLEKIQGHIRDFFAPVADPFIGQGWVKVVGVTNPYVGTGLTGEANKIFLGDEATLPQIIADQLIGAGQVKEIK